MKSAALLTLAALGAAAAAVVPAARPDTSSLVAVISANGSTMGFSAPLFTVADSESYYAKVSFGTPAQTLPVLIGSGSWDLWITSCSKAYSGSANFNPAASSTYVAIKKPFDLNYIDGMIKGVKATDVVGVAGIDVSSLGFGVVPNVDQRAAAELAPAAGIMGLALTNEKKIADGVGTPFWLALAQSGKTASPLFTLQLKREKCTLGASKEQKSEEKKKLVPGGTLTFGFVDHKQLSGAVTYTDVVEQTSWQIPFDSVKVDGKVLPLPDDFRQVAHFDSGTSFVIGPLTAIAAAYARIAGSERKNMVDYPDFDTYSIPCDTKVHLSLSFSGKEWAMNPADLVGAPQGKGKDGKEHCMGTLIGVDKGTPITSWLIGTPFLKNVFTVFDAGVGNRTARIGFAMPKA